MALQQSKAVATTPERHGVHSLESTPAGLRFQIAPSSRRRGLANGLPESSQKSASEPLDSLSLVAHVATSGPGGQVPWTAEAKEPEPNLRAQK